MNKQNKGNKENKENNKIKNKEDMKKIKNIEKDKTKKVINKKRKEVSKQTFILSLIITISFCLALILFVNLLVRGDTLANIDCTYSKLYKLSKESKEVIRNVNEPIEITIDSRLNYMQIIEILDNIIKLNNNITVKISKQEENQETSENISSTIFVRATDREDLVISFFDLNYDGTLIDFSTFKQYSLFEEKLINAIISVINTETKENPSVAFLTGLEGPEINEELINIYTDLRSYGILPISLDLSKDNIPESIKIIAIIGPMKDLTKIEYNKLLDFQAKGGDFVIAVTQRKKNTTPIFDKFLSSYGVNIPVGNLLDYRDGNRYSKMQRIEVPINYNNILLPIVTEDNDITKTMAFEGKRPFFVFPSKIVFEEEKKLKEKNLSIKNHVLSSGQSIFKEEITDQDITDNELPADALPDVYVLGSIIDKEISKDRISTAIVYSNYLFMTDLMLEGIIDNSIILNEDNLTLAKNSFTYLHPLKDKMIDLKKPLIISPYKYNKDTYNTHKILTYLIYIIITIVVITIGVVINYKKGSLEKFGIVYKKKDK